MRNIKSDDNFEVLRKIYKNPKASQRELAQDLGFSLGKLNYCLNALKNKGLVKISNFKKKKERFRTRPRRPRMLLDVTFRSKLPAAGKSPTQNSQVG